MCSYVICRSIVIENRTYSFILLQANFGIEFNQIAIIFDSRFLSLLLNLLFSYIVFTFIYLQNIVMMLTFLRKENGHRRHLTVFNDNEI